MSFPSLLDSKCDIKRESLTSDGQGGYTEAYITLYKRVPCRFENVGRGRDEAIIAHDKVEVYPDFYIYIEYRSGIHEGYHITHGGKTYEIKLVEDWSKQNQKMRLTVVEDDRTT